MVVAEGEVLAGKYRVERVLGRGGMGIVVAAEHLQLGQRVALKFLLPEFCLNGDAVARFLREARAAVQIQSEHVARVSDVGTLESGAPFLVMEFLNGSDLASVLETRGPLPIAEAVDFVLQATEAIAEAHSLGIVHRDLKPANLFLTRRRDGSSLVKVLDFGISKATQADAQGKAVNLTATSAVMGSPLYMSPEQVRSARDVDARADIWSLGVILQELLAGTPPFVSDTASALFAMIVADPPARLRDRRPDVPPALEAAVSRCLEKDRARRFENAAQFARALQPFGPPSCAASVERITRLLPPGAATTLDPASNAVGATSTPIVAGTGAAWGTTRGSSRETQPSRRKLALAAASLLGAALAGAGAFALHGRASEPSAEPSATASVLASAPETSTSTAPAASTPLPAPSPVVLPSATPAPSSVALAPSARVSSPPEPPPARNRRLRPSAPAKTANSKVNDTPPPSPNRRKDLFDDTQ